MDRKARALPSGYIGIGDDVAAVPGGRGRLLLKVDMLVESTDVPKGMTYRQAARKAVAMCVSDFAAKGARPDSFMVSLGLRRGTSAGDVKGLARGLRDAEAEWEMRFVGGDTNEARELIIDCVMAGFAQRVVERKGAKPGDALVVSGTFGFPPAGLEILKGGAEASGSFRKKAVESVLVPRPSLEVGAALAPFLSSSMDSSDGLARSLHTLAQASGVGFEIRRLPVGEGVGDFAARNRLDPERLVLGGGEEYLIVGTVPPKKLRRARAAARRAGGSLIVVGKATEANGKVVIREGRKARAVPDEGWTHLR